jgi:deoxyhypusine synthase
MKDALTEAGTLVAQARTANPALKQVLTSQQKYVTRAQGELLSVVGHAFDPLLERHIGNMVVVEITTPGGTVDEYIGIFKEYSAQFLEVMDVHVHEGEASRICDIIVPRSHAAIRHSAEPVPQPPAQPPADREPVAASGGQR